MQYDPVCAIKETGLPKEYSNSCQACSSDIIQTYPGQCQSLPGYKTCLNVPSEDCSRRVPFPGVYCGFGDGLSPQTVVDNRCCKGTRYTVFINGACPTRQTTPTFPPFPTPTFPPFPTPFPPVPTPPTNPQPT